MRLVWLGLLALWAEAEGSRVRRIVGGSPADEPPNREQYTYLPVASLQEGTTPQPLVFLNKGKRSATVNGIKDEEGFYKFLGIRYAEPPIGHLRFQRPKRRKLKGEIDATKYGAPCPQPSPLGNGFVGQEDCLFLNVHTPKVENGGDGGLPVLLWIHGGHYQRGSATQYDPQPLVRKGIVVVTIQYRLGSLGFLSIGRKELPGNVGLFDISAATRWVKDYIKYFGGNPKRLIPAGQGSGASCASMLALSNITKDILGGVLAMSGSPVSSFAVDLNETSTANEVSSIDGCGAEKGIKFVKCMQALPLETILKGDSTLKNTREKESGFPKGLGQLGGAGPAEEGGEDTRFLPSFVVESPLEAIKKGHFPKIPLMTGVTKQETNSGVKGNFLNQITKKLLSPGFLQSDLFNTLLETNTGLYENKTVNPQLLSLFKNADYLNFFTKLLTSALSDIDKIVKHTTDALFNLPAFVTSHLWSQKSRVFMYSFEHTPSQPQSHDLLNGLPLVSGTKDSSAAEQEDNKGPAHGDDLAYLFDIRSLEGGPLDSGVKTEEDQRVRDHFTNAVAEFARSGEPKVKGSKGSWVPFTAQEGNYMILSGNPQLAKGFHKCEMGLWAGDSGLLGSPECSFLGQASKFVQDTLGSAGSSLFSSVSSLSGISKPLTDTAKPLTDTVAKPLGSVLNPLGSLGGPSTQKPSKTTTRKPAGLLSGVSGILG